MPGYKRRGVQPHLRKDGQSQGTRLVGAAILLSVLTLLGSCQGPIGKNGRIYAQVEWAAGSRILNLELGGFPATATPGSKYEIRPGTYLVKFTVNYAGQYFPGNAEATGSQNNQAYWASTYTVTSTSGSLFKDGQDKEVRFYLNRSSGLKILSGDATLVSTAPVPQSGEEQRGTQGWTSSDGSFSIQITNQVLGP